MKRRTTNRYNAKNRYSSTQVKTKWQKLGAISLTIIRFVLAAVFIFSGFVKAIDPLGSTYKFEDYLTAFGTPFSNLSFMAFPAAIALSTLELAIGFSFLFKIKPKTTSIIALLFMLVMLPLTLYIALYNPVTDCGCFGDALVISNWATFYKNIVITLFIVALLVFNKRVYRFFMPAAEWAMITVFVIIGVGISLHSYYHLPILDFRPYKVGVNIPEAMKIPEGMPLDKYETKLIYEKGGVDKEFTLENYPKNDSTWRFVGQKSILIEKGYEPAIHDFNIVDENGIDLTDNLIHHAGKVHFVIMYDLGKSNRNEVAKTEKLFQQAKQNNETFYALTASTDEVIANFKKETGVSYSFCKTDPITLKTIIRANPGLMTIQNGTIINKKNLRDL